jgi:hypothetical protein
MGKQLAFISDKTVTCTCINTSSFKIKCLVRKLNKPQPIFIQRPKNYVALGDKNSCVIFSYNNSLYYLLTTYLRLAANIKIHGSINHLCLLDT